MCPNTLKLFFFVRVSTCTSRCRYFCMWLCTWKGDFGEWMRAGIVQPALCLHGLLFAWCAHSCVCAGARGGLGSAPSLTPKLSLERMRGVRGLVGVPPGGCWAWFYLLTPISPSGLARSPGSAERPGAVPLPAAPRRPPAPSPRALLQRGRAAGRRSPRAFHQPQPALGPLRAGAAGAAAGTPAGRSPTPETSPAPPRARLPRAAAPRRAPQRAQRALHLPVALPVGTRRG